MTADLEKEKLDDSEEDLFVDAVVDVKEEADETENTPSLCSCQHMLVSIHSTHCGICDQEITLIKQLHDRLAKLKDSTHYLKGQLEESASVYNSYERQHKTLSNQLGKQQEQFTTTIQKIESLKQDIEVVKTKHKDEIAHSVAIEQSKIGVETELHDLSQKLFEEANQMVLQEKEKKFKIQADHDHVKQQLEDTQQELSQVEVELKDLREKMADKQQQKEPKSTHENYMLRAQLDMATVMHLPQPVQIQRLSEQDSILVSEFTQAIRALKSISFVKVSSLTFMKQLIKVEIEPCLRLGPRINYKKLIDSILQNTCVLEPCPYSFIKNEQALMLQRPVMEKPTTRLWGRWTSTTAKEEEYSTVLRCYACQKILENIEEREDDAIVDNVHKFKASYFEDWNLMDSFCKDRIVSVINFYTFLRKLKAMNDYEVSLSIDSLYEEYSRLQLQMLLSRMGILPTLF